MDVHRVFLRDHATQRRFRRAIFEIVRPGDVVLDLGTGTGIHAVFACRAGAARVYAVDRDAAAVAVARQNARHNGCGDRVVCLEGRFPRIDLPERVDVVVTNQSLSDTVRLIGGARERFLKPGGRLIPSAIQLCVVPLECPDAYRDSVRFWTRPLYGVDFSPMRCQAANTVHDCNFSRDGFLARSVALEQIDLTAPLPTFFRWVTTFVLRRPGTLNGLGAWFEYRLSPTAKLSTRPPMAVASPPWNNALFPFADPPRVAAADRLDIELRLSVQPTQHVWTWQATGSRRCRRGWVEFFREQRSTVQAWALSTAAVQRVGPRSKPTLSQWGEARFAVLSLCDGSRSVAEIEHEVQARYPDLFPSRDQAEGFVAEVIGRDAR